MSVQEDFAEVAYRKAILQHVEEYLRSMLVDSSTLTNIRSEDLPYITSAVPARSMLSFISWIGEQIQKQDEALSEFTLVRRPAPELPPSTTQDPFHE